MAAWRPRGQPAASSWRDQGPDGSRLKVRGLRVTNQATLCWYLTPLTHIFLTKRVHGRGRRHTHTHVRACVHLIRLSSVLQGGVFPLPIIQVRLRSRSDLGMISWNWKEAERERRAPDNFSPISRGLLNPESCWAGLSAGQLVKAEGQLWNLWTHGYVVKGMSFSGPRS